jgi:thiazole/oxazole-forming peptide maturase SagD family component
MTAWHASPYTGLFRSFGPFPSRPHDPPLALCAGSAASWLTADGEGSASVEASGIGWDADMADGACAGEAIERLHAYPASDDHVVGASYAAWPLDEPAVPPERWVLFHSEQYRQDGFPFEPFTKETTCPWMCCRQALTGEPWWVPADFVYLHQRGRHGHGICPGLSTGLASGRTGDPILLRGLQEVIERDAVMGAWWGRYGLEEYTIDDVLSGLRSDAAERVLRLNLTYRCFRVVTPFSDHVSLVTIAGADREGWCFSVGSACRATAAAGWNKALLEAIHGRHYVRYLKKQLADGAMQLGPFPLDFAQHAVWYSVYPDRLADTVLGVKQPPGRDAFAGGAETVSTLAERLGPQRPVLFRSLTPTPLAAEGMDWHVLRVVVPSLQPLHGNHLLAHLGGPLWSPRGLADWLAAPPHPMP